MADLSEDEFRDDHVVPWIQEQHPDAEIETKRYLDHVEHGGYVDVWVNLGTHHLAVEAGNHDSSVRAKAAQAMEYAGYSPVAVPVVALPVGSVDQAVRAIFEDRGVMTWLLPADAGDDDG